MNKLKYEFLILKWINLKLKIKIFNKLRNMKIMNLKIINILKKMKILK